MNERSKISSDHHRIRFDVSLYNILFFANSPFSHLIIRNNQVIKGNKGGGDTQEIEKLLGKSGKIRKLGIIAEVESKKGKKEMSRPKKGIGIK